ncbi:MAG TPA: hypothetical protein VFO03_06305 [Gaiellaceae bacterium]|nr:hypothetical protein [Gaiellaceae bacterium]
MSGEENGRVVVLCERLLEATRKHAADWNREAEDLFVWKGSQGTVSIGSRDKDGEPPYQLTVVNADGDTLEELRSDLVADDQPAPWNEPLAGLYRAARRRALKADEVLEAMIEALR